MCLTQFADIKLPFQRGSMDDIEDEVCTLYILDTYVNQMDCETSAISWYHM